MVTNLTPPSPVALPPQPPLLNHLRQREAHLFLWNAMILEINEPNCAECLVDFLCQLLQA